MVTTPSNQEAKGSQLTPLFPPTHSLSTSSGFHNNRSVTMVPYCLSGRQLSKVHTHVTAGGKKLRCQQGRSSEFIHWSSGSQPGACGPQLCADGAACDILRARQVILHAARNEKQAENHCTGGIPAPGSRTLWKKKIPVQTLFPRDSAPRQVSN
ncbi:hypothetical protein KIL84_005158 [Mauremys mutica]|uniref:Uncharacterized protein n=1 Tax=Mauremys mutica TaxID=74926 RepID=A0A9D3XK49_9SAUR|nr:hypothetical protein KIL84_005158 [Mauremys mutica]